MMLKWFRWFLLWLVLMLAACREGEPLLLDETAVPAKPTADTPAAVTTALPPPQVTAVATTSLETDPAVTSLPPTVDPADLGPGALIAVSMDGQAGVLLDEFPESMRAGVTAALLSEPESYWQDLARRQIALTYHRLNFRNFVYDGKGQLPLPPKSLWQITLDATGPKRQLVDGHDLLVVDYQFNSTLLTDEVSPGEAEPALDSIGGVWEEPFIFPLDPDLLVQRTGNACINESAFPPNSYDSENTDIFYDFACVPESTGALGCHRTVAPTLTCLEAVDARVGRFETAVRYERLPWDAALADQVRTGLVTNLEAPDMQVVADDLLNYRIIYRYFAPDSCALGENAIGGTGWRRLLQFDATLYNVGAKALEIGPVVMEDPLLNMFQYNACHDHFHFSHYGEFAFAASGQASGSKQAFCVESTDRVSNNEISPLTHPYSCGFQGIQAGWIDEYDAGLDVQWIDITDIEFSDDVTNAELSFLANLDQFLCEGTLQLDAEGNQLYEPSGFRTDTGLPVSRPQCEFIPDWEINNRGTQTIPLPAVGSFVTEPCDKSHPGPLRNCGFVAQNELFSCEAGEAVAITAVIEPEAPPQTLRICEVSSQLGTGVACTYEDAIVNVVLTEPTGRLNFSCPLIRDAETIMGGYAGYTAPAFANDAHQDVTIEQN